MVYGLWRALPGAPGFLATVIRGTNSTNLTPASGCQDHTSFPSASGAVVYSAIRVHRIPPRVRDDPDTPLVGRDGGRYRVICVFGKAEYFLKRGLTPIPNNSL